MAADWDAGAIYPTTQKLPAAGELTTCAPLRARDGAEALLVRIGAKDEQALNDFYELFLLSTFSLARHITRCRESAQEIVCDVFLYVWQHAQDYDAARGSVRAWLGVATRNRAIDSWRKIVRHPHGGNAVGHDGLISQWREPQQILAQFQDDTWVHEVLSSLSPLRQNLIGLAFFDGLTHEQIAARMGMPLGTVKSHLKRALGVMKVNLCVSRGTAWR